MNELKRLIYFKICVFYEFCELNSEKADKIIDIPVGGITTDTTQTFTINYSADNYYFVGFYFTGVGYTRTYAPIHDTAIDTLSWSVTTVTLIKKFPTAYQGKDLHFLVMPII